MSQNISLNSQLFQITRVCEHGINIKVEDEFFETGSAENTLAVMSNTLEVPPRFTLEALEGIKEEQILIIIKMYTQAYLPPLTVVHYDMEKAIAAAYDELKLMGHIR